MFKSIVAAKSNVDQNLDLVSEEALVELVAGQESLHADEVAHKDQYETLKNARALRTALEQFGTDATATRALLAFADADGQLSTAFGIALANEALSDDMVLAKAAAVRSGLEAYLDTVSKEHASMEGLREILDRKKKSLASVGATIAAGLSVYKIMMASLKVGASSKAASTALKAGSYAGYGLGFLVTAGALYLVNKVVNAGYVAGTYAEYETLIHRAKAAVEILKLVNEIKSSAQLKPLAEKAKKFATEAGITIDVDSDGDFDSRIDSDPPARKMIKWPESGWTPEKAKAAATEYKKFLEDSAVVVRIAEQSESSSLEYSDLDAVLYSAEDLAWVASTQVRKCVVELTALMKSVAKFVTDKKPEEASE